MAGGFENFGEAGEIGFDFAQELPDLSAALLDGHGTEAHLQGIQHGGEGAGARDDDSQIPLQGLDQIRLLKGFGIKAFDRQEHDGKVCGGRRRNILAGDLLRFRLQTLEERLAGGIRTGCIAGLGGFDQPNVILLRELAVDREADRSAGLIRKQDGVFHPLRGTGYNGNVLLILAGSQRLADQVAELHFAPDAAGLDVGQNLFQVADAGSEGMHFAKALVDGFEALADLGEAGVQLFFQAFREALIHRFAHFGQLALVFQAEDIDLFLLVPGGKENLALHALEQGGLVLAHLGQGGHQVLVGSGERIHRVVMLGVEAVEELIAQGGEVVLLLELGCFLAVGQGGLAEEQDDEEDQAGQ